MLQSVANCPMMSLPDEVLCHVFSFVTDICSKMHLESVCKRFQRISTTRTECWERNDELELVAECFVHGFHAPEDLIKYLADCARYHNSFFDYLNGQRVSLKNWAKAIDQLLQRTVVHKLCIHLALPTDQLAPIQHVFELLQNKSSRLKLTYIELHHQSNGLGGLDHCRWLSEDICLWAVLASVKTLESVVLSIEDFDFAGEKWDQLCAGLEACNSLRSFSIQINPVVHFPEHLHQLIDALRGKPLNSITIGNLSDVVAGTDTLTEFLLPICENASGNGIASLKFTLPEQPLYGLVDFANALYPPSTQSLVELWLANASVNHVLADLNHLPAIFPNLKELYLVNSNDPHLDEELFNTQFFTVCDETPLVHRKVFISLLGIDNEDEFRVGIAALCDEQGVQAVYGEGEKETYLTLNKGLGTIEICKLQ